MPSNTAIHPPSIITTQPNKISTSDSIALSEESLHPLTNTIQVSLPPEPTCSDELRFNDFTWILSVVLIIAGWCVIYRNAQKLATRGETRSIISDITAMTNELDTLATDYWLAGRKDRIDSVQYILRIQAKMLPIGNRIQFLYSRKVKISPKYLSDIASRMTLDCEDVDRLSKNTARERLQLALDATSTFIIELNTAFEETYKPSF